MLPKIISNIILAGIAIFIIYTIAPLLKEYLLVFFGAPKKKNYSKDEFEELVKRKTEMLSVTNRPTANTATEKAVQRNELDYLIENKYFLDDTEKNLIFELKGELNWGQGQLINKFKNYFIKYHLSSIEDKHLVQFLKSNSTKAGFLNLFPQKGINLEDYFELLISKFLVENINNDNFIEKIAKHFLCSPIEFKLLLITTIKIEQKQDWLNVVDDYIENKKMDNPELSLNKNIKISELMKMLRKNIDIIIPLSELEINKLEDELKNKKNDSEFIKKKHKKLLTLYHPDKWSYENKTSTIDKRLRENFEKVQLIFKNL